MAETNGITVRENTAPATLEQTRGGHFFTPRVDIFETDQELTLCADMPGVRPENVDLRYERGELHVHGKVQPRQHAGSFVLNEYEEGDFYRAFSIHESIDNTKIRAECKHGVLMVHLPKAEAARPRQIAVKGE